MLLFKREHVPLILDGTKTETRRLWIDKKTSKARVKPRCLVDKIHLAKTKMLSKEYFAKLLIKKVWKEPLGDITDEGAIREGYKNREVYLVAFFEINEIIDIVEKVYALENELWVVRFELNAGGGIND